MGAASACVVGAESVVTRESCVGGSGGKGPTDRTHESAREGEQTGGRANKRGLRDRESKRACVERTDTDRSTPPGRERERGKRERAWDSADRRDSLLGKGRLGLMG
jgi:hypothetical protein